jgi:hypothetical protein
VHLVIGIDVLDDKFNHENIMLLVKAFIVLPLVLLCSYIIDNISHYVNTLAIGS